MLNEEEILQALKENKIAISGQIVKDLDTVDTFYVNINVTRDVKNHQEPSNAKLLKIKSQLESEGGSVIFLLVDSKSLDIEAGLRATLLHSFGNEIRNSFLSLDNKNVFVWLDHKRVIDEELLKIIKSRVEAYLHQFNLNLVNIATVSGGNLPTNYTCLKALQILSPASLECLNINLTEKGFTVPSNEWLSRRLDALRKSGKVIRLSDGSYSLTLDGIQGLGIIKGPQSRDIARLLALAKRG